SVNLDAAIARTGDQISVRLVNDGAALARRVSGSALAGQIKEVALPILQQEAPLLVADLKGGADYDLRLGAIKANAPLLLGGPKPLPVALVLPELRLKGTFGPGGGEGTIQLADASLEFPSVAMTARGIRSAISSTGDAWSADISVAAIAPVAKPPPIAPLSLTGRAEVAGGRLSFAGRLSDSTRRLASTIE